MAEYVNAMVSDAVTEGLASTIASQPDDPVDYLGRYLLNLVERKEAEAVVSTTKSVTRERERVCAALSRDGCGGSSFPFASRGRSGSPLRD